MAFSESVKEQALKRAGGKCECTMKCSHHTGRCNALLSGGWHLRHRTAIVSGGDDTLSNCLVMCATCHSELAPES